ncbi:MAG TPA: hypothetical protein VEK79_05550 [Thermoanaerobaculia bacterium]|nr:hypothetical protein [Thermoanaerobaculia bacterium]
MLPLFPELELVGARVEGGEIVITLKNVGAFTIRTRTYGEPEYRLIAKLFDGDRVVQDRWLPLPCDLEPGAVRQLALPLVKAAAGAAALHTLRLYHALQDIPMVDAEPFAEVRDVR